MGRNEEARLFGAPANVIDASKIFKAEISDSTGGFPSPDSRDTEAGIFNGI